VPNGHVLMPIKFDHKHNRWVIGKRMVTPHVAHVYPTEFPLRTAPVKGSAESQTIDQFVDSFSPDAVVSEVYVVRDILNKRVYDGELQYRVHWQGYKKSEATWEPAEYLSAYGADEIVHAYENKTTRKGRSAGAVHNIQLSDSYLAVSQLLRKQKIKEAPEMWLQGYDEELDGCINAGPTQNLVELFGEERENVIRSKTYTLMQMLLEPKKDGRRKGRLVVRGDMEPLSWVTGPTDSPVASGEAVRTLLFSGEISGEPETIATCDARNAFRQTQPFGPDDPVRYVAYKAHKHAKLRVFRMLSSQYGCTDASMRWYNTLVPYLTEQGFVRGENDKCVFVHPESKIRVAIHVDDFILFEV
jgi:hypothetical protein